MTWVVKKMRAPDPGERFLSRNVIRPAVWLVYQFSDEARAIRRHRRDLERPSDD